MDPSVLSCSMCKDILQDEGRVPKIFPCGHFGCSICVAKLLESEEGTGKRCPECRAVVVASSVEDLPTAFQLSKIISEVQKLFLREADRISLESRLRACEETQNVCVGVCEVHGNAPRSLGCLTCKRWLCDSCFLQLCVGGNQTDKCVIVPASEALRKLRETALSECSDLRSKIGTQILSSASVSSSDKEWRLLEDVMKLEQKLQKVTFSPEQIEDSSEDLYFLKQRLKRVTELKN